jgi:hypothetical protein
LLRSWSHLLPKALLGLSISLFVAADDDVVQVASHYIDR